MRAHSWGGHWSGCGPLWMAHTPHDIMRNCWTNALSADGSINATDIWPVSTPKLFNQLPATSLVFANDTSCPSHSKQINALEWTIQNYCLPNHLLALQQDKWDVLRAPLLICWFVFVRLHGNLLIGPSFTLKWVTCSI